MTAPTSLTGGGVSRRGLLKGAAALGLLLSAEIVLPASRAEAATGTASVALTFYVRIGTDDVITVLHPACEMGQGTLSGLTQLVAEELRLDWKVVRTEQVGSDARYGNPRFGGGQTTAGSLTMRGYYLPLRKAGAEARERLVLAAAQRWGVPAAQCTADRGAVTAPGLRATYGELAVDAAALTYSATPTLVPDDQLRLIGKPVERVDLRAKTDGSAVFGIDVRLPNMLYASVQQAPKVGQTLSSFGSPPTGMKAVAVPGGVAVIGGPTTWHVMRAARDLPAVWTDGPTTSSADSALLRDQAQRLLADASAHSYTQEQPAGSNARATIASSARRVSASRLGHQTFST